MTTRIRLLLAALALVVVPGAAPAAAQPTRLFATVGPGFTITLADASGGRVTQLAPGTYEIAVDDRSEHHNFHLSGPGVEERTGVDFVGRTTWTVTVRAGAYTYVCDPHPGSMRGSFIVGDAAATPPQQPAPAATARPGRLVATVGPNFTISLRTSTGARVGSARAGRYTIVVRDRSAAHNFHLVGRGVNRRTGVAFRGTVTWRVRLAARATYKFVCDPHAHSMRGTFRTR